MSKDMELNRVRGGKGDEILLKREDIRIRDPFILTDRNEGVYYMYGTTHLSDGIAAGNTFCAYRSADLENFEGPFVVFDGGKIGFWADKDFWAPEVYFYRGRYYLFGSFKAEGRCRATQILASDDPLGNFFPLTDRPITPDGWECLDGTLWVENDVPYLVFCREWLQTENGEIWAVPLSPDLTERTGDPFLLFRAGDNPYVDSFVGTAGGHCRVTDGPFLYRGKDKLKMIWSSFSDGKYAVLEAEADHIRGSWKHKKGRFEFEGGHAMLFDDLNGNVKISLHQPNKPPEERACFLDFQK